MKEYTDFEGDMQIFSSLTTPREMQVHYNTQRILNPLKKETMKEVSVLNRKTLEGVVEITNSEHSDADKLQMIARIISHNEANVRACINKEVEKYYPSTPDFVGDKMKNFKELPS